MPRQKGISESRINVPKDEIGSRLMETLRALAAHTKMPEGIEHLHGMKKTLTQPMVLDIVLRYAINHAGDLAQLANIVSEWAAEDAITHTAISNGTEGGE